MNRFFTQLFGKQQRSVSPRHPAPVRRVQPGVEVLERRDLMTISLNPVSHVLTINEYYSPTPVKVTIDPVNSGSPTGGSLYVRVMDLGTDLLRYGGPNVYPAADVKEIDFYGSAYDDWFVNDTAINSYASGGYGEDRLLGWSGADTLNGGPGNDTVVGFGGNDVLYGGDGNDYLNGGTGNDRLFGQAGNDSLFGGDGNDWLEAGSAAEYANLGTGTDWNAHVWAYNGTTYDDIRQNTSPTCVFLAALSGAALSGKNFQNWIQYKGNYHYQVDLFRPGASLIHQDVYFDGTTKVGYVITDDLQVIKGSYDPLPAENGESWTILMQRAYLQEVDYLGVNFADPDAALFAVTGATAHNVGWDPFSTMMHLINGDVVMAADADATALTIAHHAYTVTDVWMQNGVWMIQLRNPWGVDGGNMASGDPYDGLIAMKWDDFVGYYDFDLLMWA
jgi:hypothetical protein